MIQKQAKPNHCIICRRTFYKYKDKLPMGHKTKILRQRQAITCSKTCSRIHAVRSHNEWGRKQTKKKKEGKKETK